MKLQKGKKKNLISQRDLIKSIIFFLCMFYGTPSLPEPRAEVFLGNNKPISQIGIIYGKQLGINANNGNNGNGNNSASDPYIINHDLQIGIRAYQKFNLYGIILNYGAAMAFGSSDVLFKEGIGIFVEPISVNSLNLEFEPEVILDYSVSEALVLFGGVSHSIVWTNDYFELGSWKIRENLHFKETYHNVGFKYKAFKNMVLIEARLYKNKNSEFFSLRLLAPLNAK